MRPTASSLPLQLVVFFDKWWTLLFVIASVAIMAWKGIKYIYPEHYLGWDISFYFLYAIVVAFKLFFATKANKSSHMPSLAIFFILWIVVVVCNLYFILWQVYVVRADQILNAICFAFAFAELVLGIIIAFRICTLRI
ncbi:hypothetical protein Pelo_1251 [Pelomyxa schiedti]|nr:hypothetical protein Pelo_1251 [Pelomyxa schiedti]